MRRRDIGTGLIWPKSCSFSQARRLARDTIQEHCGPPQVCKQNTHFSHTVKASERNYDRGSSMKFCTVCILQAIYESAAHPACCQ